MSLPVRFPYPPMEATSVAELPRGREWQFEPKWDGFRCLIFRDGDRVRVQSKAGKPLERYFPDVVESALALGARQFVLDGEIVVPVDGRLSFDQLLQRIHPAKSRVESLAGDFPAEVRAFDLLVDERGTSLVEKPLVERRRRLEAFAARYFPKRGRVSLSRVTTSRATALRWLTGGGKGDLDGVVAKRIDLAYRSGERDGMVKVKRMRTADCVVGGFRYASRGKVIGSLLLGLYDDAGLLHHVGFCSSLAESERRALTPRLEKLIGPPGFTGKAPGGPSRWSTDRSEKWESLRPELVVEVGYDHVSNGRFRHGTRFLRWRPDKAPRQCGMDQLLK
ncbi:MAG TPA: ATP-dependent DNA ligase [Gemmatimonadales bacterium]|nr:ATP-dependent DNA ligase [Gemmatimonadales bacterium]